MKNEKAQKSQKKKDNRLSEAND